jgi:DNA primase large subunit
LDDNDTRLAKSRAAVRQLERSLQRLERAVADHRGDLFLAEELRDARAAYSRLDAAAQAVETRLGEVVDRLRSALEG